jgi:hypothetical protein
MNFKRPYWLMLFISIGVMVIGYAAWMLARPDKAGPVLQWAIIDVGMLLMAVGVVGFVVALIWWLVAGIISSIRAHRPKH